MKKIVLSGILCFLLYPLLFSQKNVTLKTAYLPEKRYDIITKSSIRGEIRFDVDKETRELLKESGVTTPMKVQNTTAKEAVITTGSRKENGFPFQYRLTGNNSETTIAGETEKEDSLLDNLVLSGYVDNENHLEIRSIKGISVSESMKQMIAHAVELIQEKIKFPDHPLSAGDRFTQRIPFSLPLQGINDAEMSITCNFKVTKITNGFVYMDVKEELTLNFNEGDNTATLYGKGKGKVRFDIANSIYCSYYDRIKIKINIEAEGIKAKGVMTAVTGEEITINPFLDFIEEAEEQYDFADEDLFGESVVEIVTEDPDNNEVVVFEVADEEDENEFAVMDDSSTEKIEIIINNSGLSGVKWKLTEINGIRITESNPGYPEVFIIFSDENNSFSGNSGCNSFFGKFGITNDDWITLSGIGATKKACPDMSVEDVFLKTLSSVNRFSLEGEKLTLMKNGKYPVAVFVKEE